MCGLLTFLVLELRSFFLRSFESIEMGGFFLAQVHVQLEGLGNFLGCSGHRWRWNRNEGFLAVNETRSVSGVGYERASFLVQESCHREQVRRQRGVVKFYGFGCTWKSVSSANPEKGSIFRVLQLLPRLPCLRGCPASVSRGPGPRPFRFPRPVPCPARRAGFLVSFSWSPDLVQMGFIFDCGLGFGWCIVTVSGRLHVPTKKVNFFLSSVVRPRTAENAGSARHGSAGLVPLL